MSKKEQGNSIAKAKKTRIAKRYSFSLFTMITILVVVFFIVSGSVLLGVRTISDIKSRTVDFSLKNIGELATQSAYYTNVQVISKERNVFGFTVPLTQSNYIFSYNGVIKAGFDFNAIEIVTDETVKAITVVLPEPIIISNEMDESSLEIYDEMSSMFTPLKLGDINASQSTMKEEALPTAISNGIFESARVNVEILLRGLISSFFDLQVYSVTFK